MLGVGLYNFPAHQRPVPCTVHVSGFSGKHYCPRMQSMNKPTYKAIQAYSQHKPVLIFVSSRRQTRLTAIDLITFASADNTPTKVHTTTHVGPLGAFWLILLHCLCLAVCVSF